MSYCRFCGPAGSVLSQRVHLFTPDLVIRIKTKSARGAVTIGSQKAMFRRETGDDYSGFAEVMPWEETLMAMNEVGTMIDDLQKQGNYAVDKWSW